MDKKSTVIVCMGEILVDMISMHQGQGWHDVGGFYLHFGGAPANVAVNLSRLGSRVAFLGSVGKDQFGDYLLRQLERYSVDTTHVSRTDDARTTLAFINLDHKGEPSFLFYRNPGADTLFFTDRLNDELIAGARILHVGTLSLSQEPFREAQFRALEIAQENGVLISCDVNFRSDIWTSNDVAQQYISRALDYANVIKVSKPEFEFLTSTNDLARGSRELWRGPTQLFIVTLGQKGCFYRRGGEIGYVPSSSVQIGNQVGAGDAFVAGLLHYLSNILFPSSINDMRRSDVISILRRANAVGALVATATGAVPSVLDEESIESILIGKHPKSLKKRRKLVLFDIDGTLIGNLEVSKAANVAAVSAITRVGIDSTKHEFDGNTDPQNLTELLRKAGLSEEQAFSSLPLVLDEYVRIISDAFKGIQVEVLPGVHELLEYLSGRDDVVLGLLTGNVKESAQVKLQLAGLARYFLFGVYGSDRSDRYELPLLAQSRAYEIFGHRFEPSDIVVIGDTIHDVGCAKQFGAVSIAVATGAISQEQLASSHPDLLLKDLTSIDQILDMLT